MFTLQGDKFTFQAHTNNVQIIFEFKDKHTLILERILLCLGKNRRIFLIQFL
jgi:hypothetical protein